MDIKTIKASRGLDAAKFQPREERRGAGRAKGDDDGTAERARAYRSRVVHQSRCSRRQVDTGVDGDPHIIGRIVPVCWSTGHTVIYLVAIERPSTARFDSS